MGAVFLAAIGVVLVVLGAVFVFIQIEDSVRQRRKGLDVIVELDRGHLGKQEASMDDRRRDCVLCQRIDEMTVEVAPGVWFEPAHAHQTAKERVVWLTERWVRDLDKSLHAPRNYRALRGSAQQFVESLNREGLLKVDTNAALGNTDG